MRRCANAVIEALVQTGPVLTCIAFERTVIRSLADRFPDLKEPLLALTAGIVDLLPLVNAHYYHAAMHGSFSIMALLPTVAPHLPWEALGEVTDGTGAHAALDESIGAATDKQRPRELARQLLAYCALDTLATVEMVQYLSQ